jgi:protein arginine N-methyltransferase 1
MYTISDYSRFITDRVRTDAYVRAMRQVLRPGAICLDIGTGIGFFAVLACQLGARKVIAVEPDDAIEVAREVAAANGRVEQITFLKDLSTRIHLEERADVIVADLRGILPLLGHNLLSLMDARRRLLAPGGTLIPQMDTLWAAPVETAEDYARAVPLAGVSVHGVNMAPARARVVHSWHKRKATLTPAHLLAAPRQWASLNYATLETANVRGEAAWIVERPGAGHGLLVWFDTSLVDGVGFSNAPGQPEVIYGQAFFPWVHPVPLAAGDGIEVTLRADLVQSDYVWGWNTLVRAGGPGGPTKAEFRQSTFFGAALSPGQVRKRAADHRPALSDEGRIDSFILTEMNAVGSVADIARKVAAQYPCHFPTWEDALTRVADLAERYSR